MLFKKDYPTRIMNKKFNILVVPNLEIKANKKEILRFYLKNMLKLIHNQN